MFRVLAPLALAAAVAIGGAPPSGAETKPMSFALRGGAGCGFAPCIWIAAEGTITADTHRRFLDFVRDGKFDRARALVAVVISSPGGDLPVAVRLGRAIRGERFKSFVGKVACDEREQMCELAAGECHGTCLYMFAGGIRRKVHPSSKISIAWFEAADMRAFLAQEAGGPAVAPSLDDATIGPHVKAALLRYLENTRISPKLVEIASRVPPGRRLDLGAKWLRVLNVSTHVVRVPTRWRRVGDGIDMRMIGTNGVWETGGSVQIASRVTLSCAPGDRKRISVDYAETGNPIARQVELDDLRVYVENGRYVGLGDDRWLDTRVTRRFSALRKAGADTLEFSLYLTREEVLALARAKELRIGIGMPSSLDGGIGSTFALDQARGLMITLLHNCERG
ncbi:MAG: hypothetical protein KIT16_09100 [Rhodospirillaceae bacterium]|nr:hypothetical protein [Rhodospirillaceae bacterium]